MWVSVTKRAKRVKPKRRSRTPSQVITTASKPGVFNSELEVSPTLNARLERDERVPVAEQPPDSEIETLYYNLGLSLQMRIGAHEPQPSFANDDDYSFGRES